MIDIAIAIGYGVTGKQGNAVTTMTGDLDTLTAWVFSSLQSSRYTREQYHALPEDKRTTIKLAQRYFVAGASRDGYPRGTGNLLSRTFLTFDYDDVTQPQAREVFEEAMGDLGVWCVTWSTISSTEAAPKFRAVVALGQPLDPSLYAHAARVFLRVAGVAMLTVDLKSFVRAQPMFLPVHFKGEEPDVNVIDGKPWDAVAALADWSGYDLPRVAGDPPEQVAASPGGKAQGEQRKGTGPRPGSIIDAFNRAVTVRRAALEMTGGAYCLAPNGRIMLVGSKSGPGVYIIEGDRLVSQHTTDPINAESAPDGSPYSHDSWDVVRIHRGLTQSQMFDFANSTPGVAQNAADIFGLIPDDETVDGEDAGGEAAPKNPDGALPGFGIKEGWLWWQRVEGKKLVTSKIAAAIELVQVATDETGGGTAIVIDARTHLGTIRRISILRSSLASDPRTTWAQLAGLGVWIATEPTLRAALAKFLSQPADHLPRALAVTRIGWHQVGDNWAFVLPDCAYRGGEVDRDIVCTSASGSGAFNVAGELLDWSSTVATPAWGNHRLMFAIAFGLSGPLLMPTNTQGRGVHILGASSSGKSTMLEVAGSVWGGGGVEGRFIRSWRTTANALEGVAEGHNDTLVALDEVGEIDPRVMGAAVYMLANGFGKSRMGADTGMRTTRTWRVPFLSSGEVAPADIVLDATGREQRGGQSVRMVVLPSDAGAGLGAFDSCPGAGGQTATARGAAFADRLKRASATAYGTAGREMVARLTAMPDRGAEAARGLLEAFVAQRPPHDSAEIGRTTTIVAVAYAAGMMAAQWGILPWSDESILKACNVCLDAVISERNGSGGSGAFDIEAGAERLRDWIGAKGHLNLRGIGEGVHNDATGYQAIYGYRKSSGEIWFTRLGLREILGSHWANVWTGLHGMGFVRLGDGKNLPVKAKGFAGLPAGRYFVLLPEFLDDGDGE